MVQNGIRTGPYFFNVFELSSKSHFFERRTLSHVGWVVIICWRLRAPCLQVLSSLELDEAAQSWWGLFRNELGWTEGTVFQIEDNQIVLSKCIRNIGATTLFE